MSKSETFAGLLSWTPHTYFDGTAKQCSARSVCHDPKTCSHCVLEALEQRVKELIAKWRDPEYDKPYRGPAFCADELTAILGEEPEK